MSIELYATTPVSDPSASQPIDLYSDEQVLEYDPNTLAQRIEKAHYGLGQDSPGIATLQAAISSGNEQNLRDYQAKKHTIEIAKLKSQLLNDYLNEKDHPVTQDEMNIILSLTEDDMADPDTIFEKLFSQRIVNELHDQINEDIDQALDDAEIWQDDELHNSDVAQYQLQRNQSAITYLQDLKAIADKRSTGSKIWDTVEQMVPFKSWWESQNIVDTNQKTPFLQGNNWDAQSAYLHMLPPDQFNTKLRLAGEALAQSNVDNAMLFVSFVLQHGSSDQMMNNMFSLADIADVGSSVLGTAFKLGKVGVKASRASKIDSSLKEVVQAASEKEIDPTNVIAATGNIPRAAEIQVSRSGRTKLMDADKSFRLSSMWDSISSIVDPTSVTRAKPAKLAGELSRRLEDHLVVTSRKAQSAIADLTYANRSSVNAEVSAIDEAIRLAAREFDHVNSSVLNIEHITSEKANLGNIREIEITLGKPDGTLFRRRSDANKFADKHYKLPTGSYTIKDKGSKAYISVIRDVSETDASVLMHQIDTTNTAPKNNIFSQLLSLTGYAGNADGIVSTLSRMNRHVTTHATQEFNRYAADIAKSISIPKGKQRTKLKQFINSNRDWHDTLIDGKTGELYVQRGRFFNNQADFEVAWREAYGEYPDVKISEAYHTFKQLNDLHYVITNLSIYRDLARQGVMDYQIKNIPDFFQAKEVKKLPLQEDIADDAGILQIDHTSGNVSYFTRNNKNQDQVIALNQKLNEEGYKILQVADPTKGVFKDLTDGIVHFVIVKDFQRKALDMKQIPYNPGGHVKPVGDFIVKQPKITTKNVPLEGAKGQFKLQHSYHGDTAAWIFNSRAEAEKYSSLLNQAMDIPVNNPKALKQFLEDKLDGILSRQEFNKMFVEINGIPAKFRRGVKFVATEKDVSVEQTLRGKEGDLQKQYKGLMSAVSSPYNLYKEVSTEFTGARGLDIETIKELPVGMRLQAAEKIDSLEMMSRNITQLTKNRWFRDYQYQALSSWFNQFQNAFSLPLSELTKDSLYYLHHPPYVRNNARHVADAEMNRRAIVTFLAQQTKLDKLVQDTIYQVVDSIYTRFGQKFSDFSSGLNVTRIDDPIKRMRAIAFHPKLGLFNPVQLFIQSQTLVHMGAITGNPVRVAASQAGAFLMRVTNDAALDHLEHYAIIASKLGWTKEGFKESFLALRSSGWANVGGEIGQIGEVMMPGIYTKSKAGKFFDKGAMFFRGAERNNRIVAWNIAYKEFRKKFPTKPLVDRDVTSILMRADDLTLNMTRASNSSLQRGLFSIPLQFYSYQQRLWEQMLGGRLTNTERARVFAVYSALYGVPGATGVGGVIGAAAGAAQGVYVYGADPVNIAKEAGKGFISPLWPFYDDIKTAAMERGIDLSNPFLDALVEGIPAAVLDAYFDKDYNIGQRYGPSGSPMLRDLLDGDKTFMEIATGVSGSVVGDIIRGSYPIIMGLADVFEEGDDKFPLTFEDFLDVGRGASSVNNAVQMWGMLNSGFYITKNGTNVTDTDMWDALAYGFLGLSPRSVSETFLQLGSTKDKEDAQRYYKTQFNKNLARAVAAESNEDRVTYMKKAKAFLKAGGFKENEYGQLLSDAIKSLGPLSDKVRKDFYLEEAPAGQAKQRQDYFLKELQKGN